MAKKGAQGWGKNKRGKGTKLMIVADGASLTVALSVGSAWPHEIHLLEDTLEKRLVDQKPEQLIGDRAYDSDPLDEKLAKQGVLLITPHKPAQKVGQQGRVGRNCR